MRNIIRAICNVRKVHSMSGGKALKNGDAFPPIPNDLPRLYSSRFCPYAQRTRIVLQHKKIPYDIVNIHLRDKPDWFLERTSLGLVPTLEHKGHIVFESRICDEFLDDTYPDAGEGRLTSDCPVQRSRDQMIMSVFDSKVASSIYWFSKTEYGDKEKNTLTLGLTALEKYLGNKQFFGGNKPNMVDFHMCPFFERMPAISQLIQYEMVPTENYPGLAAWMKRILEVPAVKATTFSTDLHKQYQQMIKAGDTNRFNLALDNTE